MTNRELLNRPRARLRAVDKQRLFLLRVEGTPRPCPACARPVTFFEAAGLDLDRYDFGKTQHTCRCPHCGAGLEQVVPLFSLGPLWSWQLAGDWLREQLDKARAWDRHQQPREEKA